MADLKGFVDIVEGGGAGFLVPVFRAFIGANSLSIQVFDDVDRVVDFKDIDLGGGTLAPAESALAVEIGGQGVWAFRDAAGKIHAGTAAALRGVVAGLLEADALSDHALFAAELAEFHRLSLKYPQILKQAYGLLAIESRRAADIWRDTQILAPAVRRDMIHNQGRIGLARVEDDMIVLTRGGVVEIHVEHPWPTPVAMKETLAMAGVFGVHSVIVRPLPKTRANADEAAGNFELVGVGGIARSVMKEPMFQASSKHWGGTENTKGAMGLGSTLDWNGGVVPERPLHLLVAQSDPEQIEVGIDIAASAPDHAVRHLINLRPTGHGAHRLAKVELDEIAYRARRFDLVWIVANHRHRKRAWRPNNLTATSFAGRTVRSLVISLLSQHGRRPELEATRRGRVHGPIFALAGMAQPARVEGIADTVRRVLHAMLADEAILHTARDIVVLLPHAVDEAAPPMRVQLGAFHYVVRLLGRVNPGRSKEAVGWALDVRLAERNPAAYRDFCSSLLAGYGWEIRAIDERMVVVEHRGLVRRVWTISDLHDLDQLLSSRVLAVDEIIITNQAAPREMLRFADDRGWLLLHHAQIAIWMADDFGVRAFEDW